MSKISTRLTIFGACIAVSAGLMASMAGAAAAATCTETGFVRDGIDLTAALINPTAPVTGEVDATGCNIGVYYGPGTTGSVSGANIHGANYYGVVVNAAAVNVTNSSIHDIGETPLNGAQHGVGVFYTTLNPDATSTGTAATGTVSGNIVTKYQKGGIVVNGPGAAVTISGNTVTGEGPVAYIAQNGIQVGRGATGTITGNTVTGNAYTGANNASSTGILVFGGGVYGPITTGVSITNNTLTNNDMGVYVYNADASGSTRPRPRPRTRSSTTRSATTRPRTSPATALRTATRSGSWTTATGTTSSTTRSAASATRTISADRRLVLRPVRPIGSTKPHFNNNG